MKNRQDEIRRELKNRLTDSIDYSKEISDEEMWELIDEIIIRDGRQMSLSLTEKENLRKELFHAVRKLDVLQELIEDTEVT